MLIDKMKYLIIIAAAFATCQAVHLPQEQTPGHKIFQGAEAQLTQFPWMVWIESKHVIGADQCGGVLISKDWVLTSANCIKEGITYEMHFGGITTNWIESGRVSMTSKASMSILHPKFDEATMNYDLALIQLPRNVTLSDRVKPIAIPKKGQITLITSVYAMGWGKVKEGGGYSSRLRYVQLSSILNSNCQNYFGRDEIISSSICAQGSLGATPCDGDEGGPLATIPTDGAAPLLVGIYSFHHKTGCATDKPTVYVRLEPLFAWIQGETGIGA